MGLLEEITLTDSIEIRATPERVFDFLVHLVDDASYRAWHPEDHVSMRWLRGEPWQEGSVACAAEYLHGKLHRMKFVVTRVVPNCRIEYVSRSRLLRIYFPGNAFLIEPRGDSCVFTATGSMRVGRVMKFLLGKKLQHGLESVRKHMREEGENMKKILEAGEAE